MIINLLEKKKRNLKVCLHIWKGKSGLATTFIRRSTKFCIVSDGWNVASNVWLSWNLTRITAYKNKRKKLDRIKQVVLCTVCLSCTRQTLDRDKYTVQPVLSYLTAISCFIGQDKLYFILCVCLSGCHAFDKHWI